MLAYFDGALDFGVARARFFFELLGERVGSEVTTLDDAF